MPYVTTHTMLLQAQDAHYAVGAFNIENMEMAQAVVAAAEKMRSPVILATTPSTIRYASPALFSAVVRALAREATVQVALHLDHGDSLFTVQDALQSGYSSVMIDASKLGFEENIAEVQRAVAAAAPCHVPVEAELGKVGGKEDGHMVNDPEYTDPDQARIFVDATGIHSLAVAIGTAYGIYKAPPQLELARLLAIRKVVDIPLVLHGSSGLSDDVIRECVARGICKVNFATELRQAFTRGMREAFAAMPLAYDPKAFLRPARDAVTALVCERIKVCGSDQKN